MRKIARVPQRAVVPDDDIVGPRALGQRMPSERGGFGVKPADVVAGLADEPDAAVGRDRGITRTRILVGYAPFVDGDFNWVSGGCDRRNE